MRILIALLSACFFAIGLAMPAQAEIIQITKVSESSLKGTCEQVGGSFTSGGGGYSCEKKCKGGVCGVYCNDADKKTCGGVTPDRVGNIQGTVGDLLAIIFAGDDDAVEQPTGSIPPTNGSLSDSSNSAGGPSAPVVIIY